MAFEQKTVLESELSELFDLRIRKQRQEKILKQEVQEVKKDINMLILMFSQGISDMSVYLSDSEILEWDGRVKRLVYHKGPRSLFLEGASNDILLRIRPFLGQLVQKAKDACA